ncbi:MAG TPA: hypothetical protein VNY84_08685 [Acidimicrobiales bacterium]|jgi:hypothetical protein|nr:hypothetical protein [Acidimicrobiales bacterium]
MRAFLRRSLSTATFVAAWPIAATAFADDPSPGEQGIPGATSTSTHEIDRTWLYADDARVALPTAFIGMSSVSYTDVGGSPTRIVSPYPSVYRAFAGNTAQPGAMVSLGGEVGVWPSVSVVALGQAGFGGIGPSPSGGAIAGVRFQLLPSSWQSTHLVASLGYLREAWQGPVYEADAGVWHPGSPNGDNGAWLAVAFSGDIQRLRLAATIHGEHIFAEGRDGVDVMVNAGASYRVVGALRAGVEYVGQDLEESLSPAAESGARHFIGPTASLQLLHDRLTLAAGPAIGLSALSPRLLGRFTMSYGF